MNIRAMSTKKKTALGLGILLALFLLLGACESSKAKSHDAPAVAGTAPAFTQGTPAPQAAMSEKCLDDTRQQDAITANASLLHEKIAVQPEPAACAGVSRTTWDAFVKADTAKLAAALR